MKKHNVKVAALLLGLLMIGAAFVGCGNGTDPAETTAEVTGDTKPEENTEAETELTPVLPDTIWNREFRVLGCSDDRDNSFPTFEVVAEEYNGDFMNDAVFKRNESLRKKYGITLSQTLVKNPESRVPTEFASTEDNFDLVFVYINKIGALAQKGYFQDMSEIDYIDFSKPWWNEEVNRAVSIKGHIFYSGSNFSLRDKNRVSVMLVNDDLRKNLRLDPVQDLVAANQWTAEKMAEYVTVGSADLNGDGKHTSDDRYGLVMHSYNAFASLCFGCGIRFVDKASDDSLLVVTNPDHDSAAVDKVLAICRPETFMTPEKYNKDWSISANTLRAGRALFASTLLSSVANFNRDVSFDFTVCPNPKFDENQLKHYTIPDVYCMLYAVPAQCKNPDFVGFALEALSYESTATTYDTFIELLCKSRNVRNADSVAMINLIFDGIVYDNAIFYSDTIKLYSIVNSLIPDALSNTFTVNLASIKGMAEKMVQAINNSY